MNDLRWWTLLIPFAAVFVVAATFSVGWERPPIDVEQTGYRGTGMEEPNNPREQAKLREINAAPEAIYEMPSQEELDEAEKAGEIYENVQVLGDLPEPQFTRLMAAITEWVSPEQGCEYCHNLDNLADDSLYTKVVSRRMIQMTLNINANWQDHVKETGVTCYTCHRGQNVPEYIWFNHKPRTFSKGMLGYTAGGQNVANDITASTSMTPKSLEAYLVGDEIISVQSVNALPQAGEPLGPLQKTEQTYSYMMHFANSLGVGCTYCHNSRALGDWEQSPPARMQAFHATYMLREANNEYMIPLQDQYPEKRLGPTGDAPKANCKTCHQGVNKPLYGAAMLKDYPSLKGD
jgi:photosynthetic reaction center cytochrome c subunit